MLLQILKKLDLLVEPYEFNIHNRDRNQTILGGFISLLILVFSVFYIIGVFQKQLSNNSSIYAGSRSADTIQFSLTNENLLFAMEFSTLDGQIISDLSVLQQYFNISVQYIQQQRQVNVIGFTRNYTDMTINKCSYNTTQQFNFDIASFTEIQKQNLLCVDGSFNVHGQFYDPYFSYISIDIQVCNQALNTQCKSIEQINDFISSGVNVDLFIRDSEIKQTLNLTEPSRTFPTNIYWRLTTGIANNEDLYISPVQFDLKKDQIFSNLLSQDTVDNIFNSSQFRKQERRQSPITLAASESLCKFYFRSSQNSIYFFALYADIFTTILSSVSEATALCLAIMQFVKMFYYYYNQHNTFEVLMNAVFKFDFISLRSKRSSSYAPQVDFSKLQRNSEHKLQELFDFTISYSFFQFISYKICKFLSCLQKKNFFRLEREIVISQIAKTKIENDLDLTNILKKLYEIDCLKLFLFDDDQLTLFNSFCSPVFQDQMLSQKNLIDLLVLNQQKRSINKLNNNSKLNTSQISKVKDQQVDYTFVATSDIPLNIRLAKVARFFKAQLEAQNGQQLINTFKKIKNNLNSNTKVNESLIKFTSQNQTLYKLVSRWLEVEEQQAIPKSNNQVPEELEEEDMLKNKQQQQQVSEQPMLSNSEIQSKIQNSKNEIQIELESDKS